MKILIGATEPKHSSAESCAPSTGVSCGNPLVPHSGRLSQRANLDLSHVAEEGMEVKDLGIFLTSMICQEKLL